MLAIQLITIVAVLAWLSAAWHALMLVEHRHPDITVGQLLFQGFRFFSATTFKESGQPLHRRFVRSALVFFGCIVLVAALSALLIK